MLDPNPDAELRRFLTFFNSNSNSESSCYIVLDPNPDPNLDSELRHFLTFSSPNSNSESGKKWNYNSSTPIPLPHKKITPFSLVATASGCSVLLTCGGEADRAKAIKVVAVLLPVGGLSLFHPRVNLNSFANAHLLLLLPYITLHRKCFRSCVDSEHKILLRRLGGKKRILPNVQ